MHGLVHGAWTWLTLRSTWSFNLNHVHQSLSLRLIECARHNVLLEHGELPCVFPLDVHLDLGHLPGSKAAFDQTSRNKSWHIEPPLSMCRLEIALYLLSPACLHITSQPAGADLANSQKSVYRWQQLLSKTSFDSTLHRNINCQKYKVNINVRFKY